MPQLEGPTTKIYNYVLEGLGQKKAGGKKREKKKDWQQLLAQVPIFKKNFFKKRTKMRDTTTHP